MHINAINNCSMRLLQDNKIIVIRTFTTELKTAEIGMSKCLRGTSVTWHQSRMSSTSKMNLSTSKCYSNCTHAQWLMTDRNVSFALQLKVFIRAVQKSKCDKNICSFETRPMVMYRTSIITHLPASRYS